MWHTFKRRFAQTVSRTALVWILMVSVFVGSQCCCGLHAQMTLTATNENKPNIILINLDDADVELMSRGNILDRYPNLRRFVNSGIQFTNFHATTPLCGPSRASLLRGSYAHNTGVMINDPNSFRSNGFTGGVQHYHDRGYFSNDLSTWMQDAGYRTMMVGKFLHGGELLIVPEGWDDFYCYHGAAYYGAFRFTNETNPQGQGTTMPESSYRTELETADSVALINRHIGRNDGKPFFLFLNPLAPHTESNSSAHLGMIAAKYKHWWTSLQMPGDAAINEKNMSDKSTAIRDLNLFGQDWLDLLNKRYRDRVLAMRSVDDMFGEIYDTLRAADIHDNTYIILTSDNGMLLGQHRLFGKANAYDRVSRVPTYVIGPGIQGGQQAGHLLAQIDFAPTIVDLAGGQIPDQLDGKSFRSLLFNPGSFPEQAWRDALLIENWESRRFRGQMLHQGSNAVRFFDEVYAEWADGTPEFYRLGSDPLQLRNTYNQMPTSDKQLAANYLRLLKDSGDEPKVTVSGPWEDGILLNRKESVYGMAQDNEGVDRVRVAVRRISDFQFWNGSGWQTGRATVAAEVTSPGQQLTTWKIADLPRMQSSDELIGVWPRVYDVRGNVNRSVPGRVFRIDYTRPESRILSPAAGSTFERSRIVVHGTASDDRQVSNVRLVVKNLSSNMYFNGAAWKTDWTYITLPIYDDGSWNYTLPPMTGTVYLGSRAVDDSGNVEKTPGSTYFMVK